MTKNQLPIAVDLDGTLIREESHWVLWCYLWKKNPRQAFSVLGCFLSKGRAAAKEKAVLHCPLDQFKWTLNELLLEKLQGLSQRGVPLILITGAPLSFAKRMAQQVGIFDSVLASTHGHNLVGASKVKALEALGYKNFIYVGNSFKDLWIWRYAAQAWIVRPSWVLHIICRLFLRHPLFLS